MESACSARAGSGCMRRIPPEANPSVRSSRVARVDIGRASAEFDIWTPVLGGEDRLSRDHGPRQPCRRKGRNPMQALPRCRGWRTNDARSVRLTARTSWRPGISRPPRVAGREASRSRSGTVSPWAESERGLVRIRKQGREMHYRLNKNTDGPPFASQEGHQGGRRCPQAATIPPLHKSG